MSMMKVFAPACFFLVILLFPFHELLAQDDNGFFRFRGVAISQDKPMEDVVARLFKGNTKTDSTYTAKNGKFEFSLSRDQVYMIELDRFGYVKSRVIIDTHRKGMDAENADHTYELVVEAEMFEELKSMGGTEEDQDILDFPIAMIFYKAGDDEFVNYSKYTKYVKGEIKKLKESSNK